MFALSGKYSQSVSLKQNTVVIRTFNSSSPPIVFEVDSQYTYSSLSISPFKPASFALANASNVCVFDLSTGNLLFTLDHVEHTSCCKFSSTNTLFTSNALTGMVVETKLDSDLSVCSSFVADKSGISALALNDEFIAAGKSKILIFDRTTKKTVCKFTGHDSTIVAIEFLPSSHNVVSSNGKEVLVWPTCGQEKKSNNKRAANPLFSLKLDVPSVSSLVQLGTFVHNEDRLVFGVWENAEGRVWTLPPTFDSQDKMEILASTCSVHGVRAMDFQKKGRHLLGLNNSKTEEFVLVDFANTTSSLDISLVKEESVQHELEEEKQQHDEGTGKKGRIARLDTLAKKAKPTLVANEEEEEDDRPMLTRLEELSTRLLTATAEAQKLSLPTLTISLEQALQTEEKEKIEAVLTHVENCSMTVSKLNPSKCASLLKQLLVRFQKNPGAQRFDQLLVWLHAILEHHAPYVSSNSECTQMLGEIYALNQARVLHFTHLLKLKGKLDFLLLEKRNKSREGNHASKPSSTAPLLVVECPLEEVE